MTSKPGDHTWPLQCAKQSSCLANRPGIFEKRWPPLKVNAFDEGSTKTYIDTDVTGEFVLQGTPCRVTANVLNDQTETFETVPVQVELESVDCSVRKTVKAFTTEKVTRNLEAIDWKKSGSLLTNFTLTYFVRQHREESDEVSGLPWGLRDIKESQELTPDKRSTVKELEESIALVDSLERWRACIVRQLRNGSEKIIEHREAFNEEFRNGRGL